MRNYLNPVARALLALIFIISGAGKMFAFAGVAGMMGSTGFPAPRLFLAGAIAIEILGGLALLLGFQTRLAALALVVFLIPATLIFHATGISDPAQGQEQMVQVFKNLAILGGLLKFIADGAGAFALDGARAGVVAPMRTSVPTGA